MNVTHRLLHLRKGEVALADHAGKARCGLLRRQDASLYQAMHAHRADFQCPRGLLPCEQGRPPGADPFDIGDHVDWLMPMLTVDRREIDRGELLRRFVPGWQNWTLEGQLDERVAFSAEWDEFYGRWFPVIHLSGSDGLTFTRTVPELSHANDLLELNVSPAGTAADCRIELRVDGKLVGPAVRPQTVYGRKREEYLRGCF